MVDPVKRILSWEEEDEKYCAGCDNKKSRLDADLCYACAKKKARRLGKMLTREDYEYGDGY